MSGSFTIDVDPNQKPYQYPTQSAQGSVYTTYKLSEGGSGMSMTVNIGGQVFRFGDQPGSLSGSSVGYTYWNPQPVTAGQPESGSAFLAVGGGLDANHPDSFNIGLYVPRDLASASNLAAFATLNLTIPPYFNFALPSGNGQVVVNGGGITSIELVSTPEPGSIVVFSVIALAAAIRVHRSRRRPAAGRH